MTKSSHRIPQHRGKGTRDDGLGDAGREEACRGSLVAGYMLGSPHFGHLRRDPWRTVPVDGGRDSHGLSLHLGRCSVGCPPPLIAIVLVPFENVSWLSRKEDSGFEPGL